MPYYWDVCAHSLAKYADDAPEMDTLWVFPPGADHSFFETRPERVAEIAQRAFGDAKDAALAENKRLGIKSYGTDDDPPKPDLS